MNNQVITKSHIHSIYHFNPAIILAKQEYARSYAYKHLFALWIIIWKQI